MPRFVNRTNSNQMLIYTDGSCFNNGHANPSAGCAFVYGPTTSPDYQCYQKFHLERRGPVGNVQAQTSNRAEMRAVIAALQHRDWTVGGFNSVVIATDSEYVTQGITDWVWDWMNNGWQTTQRGPAMNRDLWQLLVDVVEGYRAAPRDSRMDVQFWRIRRENNSEADCLARVAARMSTAEFFDWDV
ncbi:ribonuclease H-like domain-containing protein [Penicillium verhagenii]|nr:ribonuclease H-like domain-containing protein [Penicillium verhagenii]